MPRESVRTVCDVRSGLLGHSELRVTADLYSHLQKQTAAKAARHMDAMFAANRDG